MWRQTNQETKWREVFRNYVGQDKLWLFSADQSREMNVSSDLQKTKESVQTFFVNKRRFDLIFLMHYSLKCFMETRRVSHSFSCSTTLTESSHRWAEPSALHVLCDHMWRELERVRGEEVSGSRGMFRAIRQEVQPLEKARGGGRARWWRRVMDWQAEHAGRTDHTVMLSSHFSCCLLQSRLKRRPWLGVFTTRRVKSISTHLRSCSSHMYFSFHEREKEESGLIFLAWNLECLLEASFSLTLSAVTHHSFRDESCSCFWLLVGSQTCF